MKKGKFKTFLSVIAAIGLLSTSPVAVPLNTNAASDVATESYTWQNVEIGGGGYVVNVIFNNTEKDLIYARTDMGGAYRYNPDTERWVPLTDMVGFDDWNNLGCDSLATDPVDTNRVYIVAGTYTNDWTDANGCILRSTDKGETWEVTELPFKAGANMMGRSMGERLAVDPNSNNVLYMGTRCGNGLWKSTDYGVTWNKVSSFTEVGDFAPSDIDSSMYDDTLTGVVWVTFDPTSSESGSPCQTIYAGVANKAKDGETAENTVFCSKDGGETWNAIDGQPTDGYFPHHGVLSSDGNLYITYSNGVGPYDGTKGDVWKFNTNTSEWTQISPVASSSDDNYFGYGGISVDAQNPDTLMITTLNSWWPDANIYRSTDGGETWTSFWEWNGYPSRTLRYTQDITATPWLTFGNYDNPPEPAVKIGWMIGNISIDPLDPDRMFYSTGATIYGTDNLTDIDSGGKVNLSVKTLGIEQTSVLSLISPTTGTAHLVSGLGDLTGFVHEDLTKVPDMMFIRPTFSSTTSMDYAELSPNKYVRVGNTDSGTDSRIGISYDTGNNWFSGSNCWSATSSDSTGGGSVAMSADGDTILWAAPDKTPSYSTNNGNSWTACSGLPVDAAIASDRVNSNKFYGFSEGTFYVSTDGAATFTAAATDLPNTTNVNFKAMPGIEGDIWFAGGTEGSDYGLYHSTDSGSTFTRLSNVEEADVVGFGKAAPDQDYMALYISAQIDGVRGFFRSDDAGESWVRINDDQHQYGVTDSCITGDPRIYGRVYVGTNGRGIVYGDIGEDTSNSATITPSTATFDKNTDKQADISVTMTLNDNTLTAIKNGSTTLTEGTDYSVSDNKVTIKKEYLAAKEVGTTSLTFDFSAGTDPKLKITITDTTPVNSSSISPETASFDKNVDNQADVSVTMTLNGNTLTAIKNGSVTLTEGTDYSISDNTVTINKEYLAAQAVGTTSLTFDFSAGNDPVLKITVTDTTVVNNSSISPDTASFDKNTENQADVSVTMTLNGNTLAAIKNGSTTLSEGTDYTVSDNIVTINKEYLATQSVGTTNLTFSFSAGEDSVLKVTITNTTEVPEGSLEIQMYNRGTDSSIVSISPQYKIINTGSEAINLSDVKIRYYYTLENNTSQSFWCDWSSVNCSNVTGKFVTMENPTETADCYLEIGFTSDAGSLASGESAYVQTRFNKSNWSSYTQSNDYSFNSSANDFADWTNVTAYISDSLQWGIEP